MNETFTMAVASLQVVVLKLRSLLAKASVDILMYIDLDKKHGETKFSNMVRPHLLQFGACTYTGCTTPFKHARTHGTHTNGQLARNEKHLSCEQKALRTCAYSVYSKRLHGRQPCRRLVLLLFRLYFPVEFFESIHSVLFRIRFSSLN